MFFKREKAVVLTFADRMEQLRGAGYTVASAQGATLVAKQGYAALVKETADSGVAVAAVGLHVAGEVAELTDLGYQKIFLTASGKKMPAVAEHLHGLHAFSEDLVEALGLTSLYNTGLGSTNEKHLYDRITARDTGHQPKPWQHN